MDVNLRGISGLSTPDVYVLLPGIVPVLFLMASPPNHEVEHLQDGFSHSRPPQLTASRATKPVGTS